MKKKKMLFIYNPKAGKEQIRGNLLDIIDVFVKGGYDVTAYPTQGVEDATRAVIEREDGFDIVTCSGGDGTLDEVVEGMVKSEKKLPIGYVPAGTTNDFASSLGISSVMSEAAKVVVTGKEYQCDIGMLNDDSFVYTAAFGLFTNVSYQTRQELKNVLGHMAYILEGAKELTNVKSYHLKITYEEGVIEDDFIFGMITNSFSVGGFKEITGKNVKLDDGVFEATFIKMPDNMMELGNLIAALTDRDIDTDYMYCFKTAKMDISSNENISWTRDGEYGGTLSEVSIRNINKGLTIMIPDK
ncbi:MAG: YegS/Rv2252/BmrU family lipid kinase [Butyrivibrio sp.]|nr:YegS/Rv2252/BmrU family lipid kinase [Butyrivibrio sp.]